jgi:WD40 repeat protein/predicted Ser/Thr protein kinase
MSSSRYADVARIFHEAMVRPPEERTAYLDLACGSDTELRREVDSLIAHDESPHGILSSGEVFAAAVGDGSDLNVHGAERGSLPSQIGRYRIRGLLGEGGMGSVFLAEQDTPHRTVALKVIRSAFVMPSARRRFERETRALARLQHPGIAQIYDAGTATTERGSCPFIAMEYVRGLPLPEYVTARGLSVEGRVRLVIDVCLAVQHAHDQGIVHRDIKPSNVIVTDDGRAKLLDFGIAQMQDDAHARATLETRPGQIIGTLPYMSPEQFADAPVADARSDIYALGVLLFEVLTGELPHDTRGRAIPDAVRLITEGAPRPLGAFDRSLRGDLETIVAVCLSREPGRRYASALDLARDLERHLEDQPIVARPASAWYQLAKYAKRNRTVVVLVIAALLILVAATAVSIAWSIQAEEARALADDAKGEAKRQAELADRRAYVANIAAASAALDSANIGAAQQRLNAIEPALRETWEYRHFAGRLSDAVARWNYANAPILALCPTGRGSEVLACTWDRMVHLLDGGLAGRQRAFGPLAHRGVSMEMVPSRGWAFITCYDGHLRCIHIESGRIVDAGAVLQGPGFALRLTSDASLCVVCDRDGDTRVYRVQWLVSADQPSLETPQLEFVRGFQGRAASITPDGQFVSTGFGVGIEVRRISDGDLVGKVDGFGGGIWMTEFSPDGKRLLVGSDDRCIRAFRVPTTPRSDGGLELLWMQQTSSAVMRVAWSPDGTRCAAALWNGALHTHDFTTGLDLEYHGHTEVVESMAYLPDGTQFVTGSQDHTIRLWSATSRPLDHPLPRQRRGVGRAALSGDGRFAYVVTRDNAFRIFDVDSQQELRVLTTDPPLGTQFVVSADGKEVYLTHPKAELGRWDIASGARLASQSFQSERVDAMATDDNVTRLAIGLTNGRVLMLDPKSLETLGEIGRCESQVRSLALCPDGNSLLAAGANGEVMLMSTAVDGPNAGTAVLLGRVATAATCVAVSPDGEIGYASSTERFVRAWRLTGPDRGTELFAASTSGPILCIAVTRDSSRLVGGVQGGRLPVWDAKTGELLVILTPHDRSIESVVFDRSGRRLLSASSTGTINVMDQPADMPKAAPEQTTKAR